MAEEEGSAVVPEAGPAAEVAVTQPAAGDTAGEAAEGPEGGTPSDDTDPAAPVEPSAEPIAPPGTDGAQDAGAEGHDLDAAGEFAREVAGPKQRRQMVMLQQTNDQLKKIVEYSHDLVGEVVGKLKDDLVRPYFLGWKAALAEELRAGRLARKAERMNGRLRMRQVVAGWLDALDKRRCDDGKVSRSVAKFLNRHVAAGMATWRGVVEEKKRRARVILKVQKKLIAMRAAPAWRGWVAKHVHDKENRIKARRMVLKLKNRAVAGAFNAWTEMVALHKRHRAIQRRAVAKMSSKHLLAGLEAFAYVRRRKVILQRCQVKVTRRSLAKAFDAMGSATHKKAVHKRKVQHSLGLMMHRSLAAGFGGMLEHVEQHRARKQRLISAVAKLTKRGLSRALLAWAQLIVDEVEERQAAETAARSDVEVQSLMAEVDRLGIDNRRLIRQVEQLMGTDDVKAELGLEARVSISGSVAGTPRSSRRGQPQEVAGLSSLETEVSKLQSVIAEMAEREERLLRMLQLPDEKPEPAKIKSGDFVRRNRALIHHASSFNSLLRQLRKEALEKGDNALLVNVEKMSYANLYVTDGDLHVQAVDALPLPNPRGIFDSNRRGMKGDGRAVPYFGPPKPKPSRRTRGKENMLPSLAPTVPPPPEVAASTTQTGDQKRVESIMGALYTMSPEELDRLETALN